MKDHPAALDRFMTQNLELLSGEDQNDIIKGLINCCVPVLYSSGALESKPWYPSYESFLRKHSEHSDLLIRQSTHLVRAYLLKNSATYRNSKAGMYEAAESLLSEVKASNYDFLKYQAYTVLVEIAKSYEDLDQKAALEIYYKFEGDSERFRAVGFDINKIYMRIAKICESGPLEDREECDRMYSKILDESDRLEPEFYRYVMALRIQSLTYNNNPDKQRRALRLCLDLEEDSRLGKGFIQHTLAYLYQYGPKDIRNHTYALQKLKVALSVEEVDSAEYLNSLEKLAYLYVNGDEAVKDVGEAVKIYECLREHERFKQLALDKLCYIYQNIDGYKNLPRA
ncbi:MAG: hypothetical protein K2W94_05665 [Alphaproteobacteria bacterium]|nr:hypothetical protein [Alphaproteobacteria bacterium]